MMNKIRAKYLLAEDGFSLIEIMIALTIFAIGLLALAQMQTHSIIYNSDAQRYTEATIYAQGKMDEILAKEYGAVTGGTETIADTPYTIETTIVEKNDFEDPLDPSSDVTVKEISVEVTWSSRGKDNSYTLNANIAQKD
jgi:type IV pilus modification protein PilV